VQTFTAPLNTNYKIQCWGASGGDSPNGGIGIPGKGGYSKGIISLVKDKILYVYIGEQGTNSYTDTPNRGGWNGGGYGNVNTNFGACSGGGGATDIRLIRHTEDDGWSGINSLRSRVIVAAGGGGCKTENGNAINGGYGGGFIGEKSPSNDRYPDDENSATGGTQTQGGIDPITRNPSFQPGMYNKVISGAIILSGTFGCANIPEAREFWGGGGGGGWYGGGIGHGQGGSGGSSFVSGMDGCVAMSQDGTQDSNINYQTIDGIEYKFSSATTINGGSVMPAPRGGTETGHYGNGYCIITWFSPSLQP